MKTYIATQNDYKIPEYETMFREVTSDSPTNSEQQTIIKC